MCLRFFFFFNDTATTEIYTLSLHDALPICSKKKDGQRADSRVRRVPRPVRSISSQVLSHDHDGGDRKSTRLNSSHQIISYAVFCLKKKKNKNRSRNPP